MVQKGYKYRVYPNKEQQIFLAKHFGCSRFIYNYALAKNIETYQKDKKFISAYTMMKDLPVLKKNEETLWLKEINSQTLQCAMLNLDNAFKRFFKEKKGFPKFKSKKINHHSFQVPQNYKLENGRLHIPKLKTGIKIKQHREFTGVMKTLTISQTPTGKYYATILVETVDNIIKPKVLSPSNTIGVDLGIKDFAILSTGEKIDNSRFIKKSERRLKIRQRKHSKKKKESNNRSKSRLIIARTHERVANQRKDFLHKTSSKIVRENQSICIEDLNVKGMVKNHKLAKAISDVSWGEFRRQLDYKSNWYGKNLVIIGRFEPSSKICNHCGNYYKGLQLSERTWKCENCGIELDRDINASLNIRDIGIETYRRNYGNSRLLDMTEVTKSEQEALPLGRGSSQKWKYPYTPDMYSAERDGDDKLQKRYDATVLSKELK